MPKINQEEYEVLKGLDDKWKWIARDKDGTLVMGAGKNERYLDRWFPPVNVGDSIVVDETNAVKDVSEWENLFQFIQWEDESPYNIQELIEEYENSPEYVTYISTERTRILSNDLWSKLESEEKEVKKDIKWLKDEILTDMRYLEGNRDIPQLDLKYRTLREVVQKINSLDEPEVLSQEFIDEHKKRKFFDFDEYRTEVILVEDLQNLLVPKQELPVIPKFVADWIESRKNNYPFDVIGVYLRMNEPFANEQTREVLSWIHESELNRGSFARAWLDGYEVEEEQKYYVLDKENATLLKKSTVGEGIAKSVGTNIYNAKSWKNEEEYQLTEQEIKDYDERYFAFAVKVEELEE